ncbi:hypothetical protein [Shewanella sp. NIFS-20-20]|uniref:hypothetical protein n=1 Tax=Shewanella sp. NIFS-20-20 TaxID=2853806 RepID=UPI001C45E5D2|nr:hypothetical protein [Shewanella sp. NIFS-20-20]MBV7317073.1 hypothetical protein [Shewanella sp. NIFS-20-20]
MMLQLTLLKRFFWGKMKKLTLVMLTLILCVTGTAATVLASEYQPIEELLLEMHRAELNRNYGASDNVYTRITRKKSDTTSIVITARGIIAKDATNFPDDERITEERWSTDDAGDGWYFVDVFERDELGDLEKVSTEAHKQGTKHYVPRPG